MSPKGLDLPGGCKSMEEFADYLLKKIRECVGEHKSKEETVKHLWENFKIDHEYTRICWDRLEEEKPDVSSSCATALKKSSEQVTAPAQATQADSSTPVEDSTKATESKDPKANVANLPGGCKSMEEVVYFVNNRIEGCIVAYKSKEETVKHLWEQFQVAPETTRIVWDDLEQRNPDFFASYNLDRENDQMIREQNAAKRALAQTTPSGVVMKSLTKTAPSAPNREEQISSEEKARKKQKTQHLQASQQPVSSATESVRVLEQILTTATKIATTSEQMLKLMTDAAKSREKQAVEQEQVRGENEETENLQNQNQQLPQETQRLDIPGNEDSKDNTK